MQNWYPKHSHMNIKIRAHAEMESTAFTVTRDTDKTQSCADPVGKMCYKLKQAVQQTIDIFFIYT